MKKVEQYIVSAILLLALDVIYLGIFGNYFGTMVASIQRVAMKLNLLLEHCLPTNVKLFLEA